MDDMSTRRVFFPFIFFPFYSPSFGLLNQETGSSRRTLSTVIDDDDDDDAVDDAVECLSPVNTFEERSPLARPLAFRPFNFLFVHEMIADDRRLELILTVWRDTLPNLFRLQKSK